MATEIEAKLKVESLQEVKGKLAELGAEFIAEQRQVDCYFDDGDMTLTKADRGFRLRRQAVDGNESFFLTYKGVREKSKFKQREEIEIEIKGAGSTEKLLSALGYEKILVFEKKREAWRLGDCEVALDELPLLGSFVEIEGPDANKITDVQKRLGLEHLLHVPDSYASLVAEKLRQQSYG
jgi:adenylate cyclase class 2